MTPEQRILVPFLAVIFIDTLGYATVVPIIPFALRGHGTSPVAIGIVFAAFSLCQLVTAPLLGRLSDSIGRRPVLALSQLGSVVGFALLAVSSSYAVVLVSRIIDGCSAGNVAVCYAAVIDSDSEDVRRQGIPALGAAGGAGIVVGLALSAVLAGYGLAAEAGAAVLLSLVSLALTALVVPETGRPDRSGTIASGVWRLPEVRRGGLFVMLCAALQAAFFLTLPAYLHAVLGLTAQQTTTLLAGMIGVAAGFQLLALPTILARLTNRVAAQLLIAGAEGAAVVVAVAGDSPAAAISAAVIFATVAAALAPVSALLMAESSPQAPMGTMMGLNASSATTGQIFGPLAGYAAFEAGGTRGLGVSCVALGLCAALGVQGLRHG